MKIEDKIEYILNSEFSDGRKWIKGMVIEKLYTSKTISKEMMKKLVRIYDWTYCIGSRKLTGNTNQAFLYFNIVYKIIKDYESERERKKT